jgi:two-component system, LytTR family, response regulator
MMRAIIADDEHLSRKKLSVLLSAEPGIEIAAECRNGAETIAALKDHKVELLFLDIRMPDMDGFEVLQNIPADRVPIVIFTTAFDQFAVRAFEAQALDYLLKPFDRDRLRQAINRARAEMLKLPDRETTHRLLDFLATAKADSQADRRFVLKAGGRVVFLSFDEIDWVEAAANYVKLNVGKQSYLMREGIGHISKRLDSAQFVRIHRSTVVNVKKIKELQPVNSGEYIVLLNNGKELSCSRGYRAGLQQLIDKSL